MQTKCDFGCFKFLQQLIKKPDETHFENRDAKQVQISTP